MSEPFRLLIDGELELADGEMEVINPATGAPFARCARASEVHLDRAVRASKRAFRPWAALTDQQRSRFLVELADRLQREHEYFAELLTREQGKPIGQAMLEMAGAIGLLRHFAQMRTERRVLRDDAEAHIFEQRTPLGVVAAITPWNMPMFLLMLKLAPALQVGNTIVAKPAPTTPLTTLAFGRICAEILPKGVANFVAGWDDLGDAITAHPDVAHIAFTGSTATGKRVLLSAARGLKRFTLELGGNDAAIVLDDMNPATAAASVFKAGMLNSGQICFAAKRVYAPRSMYPALCDELAQLAETAVVGDGRNEATTIGPVQNRRQYDKLLELLTDARRKGKILAGGSPLSRPGYFIPPTIVADLADDARLVSEEQFGPILPVLPYDSLDEVIERANDSPYGLGATIWSNDVAKAMEIAKQLDVGTVWVNKFLDLPFDIACGGAKQSGIGLQFGQAGLEEFTQAHVINIARTGAA